MFQFQKVQLKFEDAVLHVGRKRVSIPKGSIKMQNGQPTPWHGHAVSIPKGSIKMETGHYFNLRYDVSIPKGSIKIIGTVGMKDSLHLFQFQKVQLK